MGFDNLPNSGWGQDNMLHETKRLSVNESLQESTTCMLAEGDVSRTHGRVPLMGGLWTLFGSDPHWFLRVA